MNPVKRNPAAASSANSSRSRAFRAPSAPALHAIDTIRAAFPVRLHVRSDLHLMRKTWHMVMGMVIAFLYLFSIERGTAVVILSSVLGFDILMEAARLNSPRFNQQIMRFWGPFMRTCEVDRVSGIPYYLAASVIAIGIFPKPVAVMSILFLAIGDPLASLVGILYGSRSVRLPGGKSLIGSAAGVLGCAIVAFVFMKYLGYANRDTLWVALIGGLAGGTAELLPLDMDDNFTIPVISGFVLWFAFLFL
jgi:dolichol kinase